MSNILLTTFSNRRDAVALAHDVAKRLDSLGIASSVYFLDSTSEPQLSPSALVVSLGGDGTFLKTARLAHRNGARVLPVNLGRLGFLLNVPPSALLDDIMQSLEENNVVERLALQIVVPDGSATEFALNEVVLERAQPGHMVRVKTFVDCDEYLTYSADGVMVATPTGSTGYNFSAGGPVLDDTLPVMVLTPIAPHFTIDRSIVVGASKIIRLVADDKPALIVADGRTIGSLEPGQFIEVSRSPQPVRVVANRSFELGLRLRESLREGHA